MKARAPSVKEAIKKNIEMFLFAQPVKQLCEKFVEITNRNNELTFKAHHVFRYKGKQYTPYEWKSKPRDVPQLHESLHAEMDAYISAIKELEEHEIPLCMGYVQNVLNSSKSPADYLQLLPTALHKPIQSIVDHFNPVKAELSLTDADKLIKTHEKSVELIKYRLMMNLLDAQ